MAAVLSRMKSVQILIVDDQTLIREGLAILLAQETEIEVVGTAGSADEAPEEIELLQPDVLLMDIQMPGMNGVAATRTILQRWPSIRVLMLTTFNDDQYLFEALRAGASGYLLKDTDTRYLTKAIHAAYRGEQVLDPGVTEKVVRRALTTPTCEEILTERLTSREKQVLVLMAEGYTNAAIAHRLSLSEGTVKNHVSHILGKFGSRDRTHAVRLAVEWGLLDQPTS